jgi:polyphosphate glucokinase
LVARQPLLAFDVGGSFVKTGLVDVERGRVVREIDREPTPPGATPEGVIDLLASLAGRVPSEGPVGLAFPSVTKRGVAYTAANVDKRWIGTNAAALLEARIGRPVAFLNDADAAGIAEMAFGAGRDRDGVVMLLTLGTGIGSALFVDGRLLPNTEFGPLELAGEEAEHRASGRARMERRLDWPAWSAAVNEVLAAYHALLWPDLFIIGGGVTENWAQFGHLLTSRAEIARAQFGNDAGIVGAAMAAVTLASR